MKKLHVACPCGVGVELKGSYEQVRAMVQSQKNGIECAKCGRRVVWDLGPKWIDVPALRVAHKALKRLMH